MLKFIFDSCCLSNFALSDSMFILENLYSDSAFITNFVSAEIMRGIQAGHRSLEKIQESLGKGWLKEVALKTKHEKSLYEELSVSLGLGEASSIAIAQSRGFIFACDDKTARREAELLNTVLTGTLGILSTALKRKIITLNKANDSGFGGSPPVLIDNNRDRLKNRVNFYFRISVLAPKLNG